MNWVLHIEVDASALVKIEDQTTNYNMYLSTVEGSV